MRRFAVMVLVTTVMIGRIAVGQDAPQGTSEVSTGIESDLAALAAPQYRVREAAARRLVSRKIDAVAPLMQVALVGSTEASVRAFDILRQLYREGDEGTCTAVESALESLMAAEDVAVAARAESSIHGVAQVWHRRAIEQFVKFGGILHYPANIAADEPDKDNLGALVQDALINDSWTGGDEGLKYLRRIEDFRAQSETVGPPLVVVKGMVSKDALAALQASLPNLHIQERGPACLGVSPIQIGIGGRADGLPIRNIKPGSSADVAGLREGDVLLKFDGHEINDFDTLVEKIEKKRPGDKVPVVYLRDTEKRIVTVELQSWK